MILFDWDRGNSFKSVTKHGISNFEAESCFSDDFAIILPNTKHSTTEIRYVCIGSSLLGAVVLNVFTLRNGKIRIISSRLANKKERTLYEEQFK